MGKYETKSFRHKFRVPCGNDKLHKHTGEAQNGVEKELKNVFKLKQFEGDLIIGMESMKQWKTTIVLDGNKSFIKIGDQNLNVQNIQ